MQFFMRRLLVITIASVVLGSATPASRVPAAHAAPAASAATLVDLRDPDDLRARFNQNRGKSRIVLLVSPT